MSKQLTVKELIAVLAKQPQDLLVCAEWENQYIKVTENDIDIRSIPDYYAGTSELFVIIDTNNYE